jgi:1-acyl-sn-glycerol-3-phosphate acyltransferase
VGLYDIFAMSSTLARAKFVAKAELFRIPIFGRAARAVGTVPIQRDNRKAAFAAYEEAAARIRQGASVIVYPEGTRGDDYRLRPFKKGPFVLAIAAGAPIVPTLIHGSLSVNRRGSFRFTPGTIHIHFLEPVETAGLTYDDREQLSRTVWHRIADALHTLYGVESGPPSVRTAATG